MAQQSEINALDENAFRHFAPLLAASQSYASRSGCRFRSRSFDGISVSRGGQPSKMPASVSAERAKDPGPRLAAKLRAADMVHQFEERLRAKEPELLEEVDRAFRIVMVESVRNAMMGMFTALSMFPPSPAPSDIGDEDCSYEDVSAPLPAISQRLYNDQARRVLDVDASGPGRLERRAKTAAFIMDFAEATGVPMPEIPDTQQSMLKEMLARVSDQTRSNHQQETRLREVFLNGFGAGAVAESLRFECRKWWGDNWQKVLCAAAIPTLGAVTTAILASAAVLGNRAQTSQTPGSPR